MDRYEVLRRYFGYDTFREGQESLIDAILAGRDVFGVMPTGGGKSLCYQVPALLLPGVTIVVSPLISLMKDQVMALREANIPAAYLNSTLSVEQRRKVYVNLKAGKHKIVYIAPERLDTEWFGGYAQELPIGLVAVDEAHCISQWGQDFRPSYLKIADFVAALPKRPVLAAFTATATARVREDVERQLGLREPLRVVTGFDRPNLRFEVRRTTKKPAELRDFLRGHRGESGIVYCATRKKVERVCDELCAAGIAATRYHAGLDDDERHANQEDFVYDRKSVMVATNAFGMGIDKSNVRFVVHYNMPKSLEEYYQEAGRAGRDGLPSDCLLLFSQGDITTARFLIEHGDADEADRNMLLEQDLQRLDVMVDYCKTTGCLRCFILAYFGQTNTGRCGNCGNCAAVYDEVDITVQSQMILSCVKRIRDRLGYNVGPAVTRQVLLGSANQRIRELGLDELSTYGLLRGEPKERVDRYFEQLERDGCLRVDEHGAAVLTPEAGDVLYRGRAVSTLMRREDLVPKKPKEIRAVDRTYDDTPVDGDVFESLRALRRRLAAEEGIPAYMVFSDATLRDMARRMPQSEDEFLDVSGVGRHKAEKYGKVFLEALAQLS